jgi:hypothetical protein
MVVADTVLTGSYDKGSAVLSVVISICASYPALEPGGRTAGAHGRLGSHGYGAGLLHGGWDLAGRSFHHA